MRIVHIITRMIVGGAQENTLYNCLDLVRDFGDEVILITGPSDGPEGKLLEQGRAGGLNVRQVPSLRRAIHPVHDLAAYRELRAIISEIKPQVVHTHSAKGGLLGRAAAWNRKVPAVIHTVHGAPFHPYQPAPARYFFQACERWAARRCHRLISVANAMTDLMVDANVAAREKFVTIYSGMEVAPFLNSNQTRTATRQALQIAEDEVVIGKIARLFHLKGHEYLIPAARQVLASQPRAKFLLVGNGILRPQLEQQIEAAGVKDRFVFTGLVPPEQIPSLIGAMDILVHTSLREGLARALPQALIAGKPIISYDVDGAREVCINDQTGFLLPAKSVTELANSISRLVSDPGLRTRLGEGGQRRFTDQFRHQTMTRQIRNLYCETLIKNGIPAP